MSSYNQIYYEQINKICVVFNKKYSGSGVLFWYDTKLFLLTAKHILDETNPILQTIVNVNIWNRDKYKYEQATQVLGFTCIGYDTTSDIAVCAYDAKLNMNNNIQFLSTDKLYNKNFIEAFDFSDFVNSRYLNIADKICIIGHSMFDNNTISSGIIKDNAYNGFPENSEMVESILCDVATFKGSSGSPIINLDNKICGIVIGGFDTYLEHLTIGVSSKILRIVIPKLIKRYIDSGKTNITDISKNLITLGYPKSYLGINYNHVNYNFYIENNDLQDKLKNIGGILVIDFIVGLDTLNNSVIYNWQTITNSTITIHNPFQYNVIAIQLTTNLAIKEISKINKTPFQDLQIMNDFLGYNENTIINSGTFINVFNNVNMNTKLWSTYYDDIHKSHPLIFTKIWFTKDYYVNNINVGEWVELNIGKYRGQFPLSEYIYECSREIITDPIKNIKVYRFNSDNMVNVIDNTFTKIENMVDMNKDKLTKSDIIFEFYYNTSQISNTQGSWQGPVYQKIKPYVIYKGATRGQNNTNTEVLSIEQPDILNNLESTLQIDIFRGVSIIENRSAGQNYAKFVSELISIGREVQIVRDASNGTTASLSINEALEVMRKINSEYNKLSATRKINFINSLPKGEIFINMINKSWGINSTNDKVINLNWKDFIVNYIEYYQTLP